MNLSPTGRTWLPCGWPVYRDSLLSSRSVQYSVQSVIVSGTNVVHCGRGALLASPRRPTPKITGFFYALTITAHDAMFGSSLGGLRAADYAGPHRAEGRGSGPRHTATIGDLPLGDYQVRVKAGSASVSAVTVHLSRDKTANLTAVTQDRHPDRLRLLSGIGVAGAPLLSRTRRSRVRGRIRRVGQACCKTRSAPDQRGGRAVMPHTSGPRRLGAKWFACTLAAASLTARALAGPALAQTARTTIPMSSDLAAGAEDSAATTIPLFAYYYIWFSHNSWARAKKDLPLIGTYSSSDLG